MSSGKFCFSPALAAVSLAAAFAIYSGSFLADATSTETSTVTSQRLESLAAEIGELSSEFSTFALQNGTSTFYIIINSTYSNRVVGYYRAYNADGSTTFSALDSSYRIDSSSIYILGDYYSYDSSAVKHVISMSLSPMLSGKLSDPESVYKPIYELSGSSGVGAAFSTPSAPSPVSASDYLSSYVSSKIADRYNGGTTTTTTTTTTSTSTTVTTVTLPPFPYETAPPFELPSDWTADYQETVPTPDVGDFSVTTPAEVTAPDVPTEVAQGVGFWFTLFSDLIERFSLAWIVLLTVTVGFIIYMIWGR